MKYVIGDKEKARGNYGGKANSLLKLVENELNVPRFFIVTSVAFLKYLKYNHIELSDDYEGAKKAIEKHDLPKDLSEEIFKNWDKYGFESVAIRSSASNEDGKEKSFAGQYETFLNVKKDDLIEKIKKCWQSLFNDNVVAYSGDMSSQSMNVIVEEMVDADYAGVAFSVDPTSGSDNYSVIEACKGLGEQLVSGIVIPSTLLVRRKTLRADLIKGKTYLSEEDVSELEKKVLKIEEIYGLPVDIEWCIKDKVIYLLQARPITARNATAELYRKVISREKSIIETEIYHEGEYEGIKSLTNDLYYFKPLFIYDKKREITDVYYNDYALEEDPTNIYYYMQKDIGKTKELYAKALESCNYLNDLIDSKDDERFDYKEFIGNMVRIYPFTSLGNLAGYFENIGDEVKNMLVDFRNNYDYILYKANEYLLDRAKETLPQKYKKYLKFLFIEEIFQNKLPSLETIDKRREGYIYFGGKLELTDDIGSWMEKNNFYVKSSEEEQSVKGNIAFKGKVTGKVCQVYKKEDFKKFEVGDILVTTMTTPKFTPILKKAGAIVTDEGGITCHAAIIARELKVPCIIGCKNATEILKDGMEVDVNADKGVVSIKCD